ncbi:DUF1178 family protein [Litoreibacter arenae]|uniref:Protein family HMM n=1 Tax=Litoreibacter arenae DSM 19593 TaxID=1123360 RepID=S9QGZ9_9RHOB|nr:DUF1178 family protein [Litoreibacter arenae]EPX80731.1 protein family HMM [Litoreibacter arenae DSM 19593]
MIRYALTCAKDHSFDSWFQSADAFDKLLSAGMVTCAVCGTDEVKKSIMAPRVRTSEDKPLSAPASPAEQALKELRAKIEANSENVGKNFAKEARAMHDGTAPERAIYGEAKLKDAKALIDDGIPVVPLPFGPNRKNN